MGGLDYPILVMLKLPLVHPELPVAKLKVPFAIVLR
jgi:hypothetical protein